MPPNQKRQAMTQFQLNFILASLKINDNAPLVANFHLSGGTTISDIHKVEYFQNGMIKLENQRYVTMCIIQNIVAITRVS